MEFPPRYANLALNIVDSLLLLSLLLGLLCVAFTLQRIENALQLLVCFELFLLVVLHLGRVLPHEHLLFFLVIGAPVLQALRMKPFSQNKRKKCTEIEDLLISQGRHKAAFVPISLLIDSICELSNFAYISSC